ncbi:MAG: C25 family cysteine peptidase, partial [bacterium]|nr:C25 family cysteine peptidase [bacterium]
MIETSGTIIELQYEPSQNRIYIPIDSGYPTRKYLISSLSAIESVKPIRYEVKDRLRNPDQQADYLIITHSTFTAIAQTLAEYRRKQGLTVRLVDINDIYDQFSYGLFDPRAIRSFLQYAFYYWKKPAPNYVLLIGDASSDYKGNFANGVFNYVPAYRKYIVAGECASDAWYVQFCGTDIIPEMLIGRISVNNLSDAETIVNKIIRYEQNPEYGSWRSRILFMADDGFEENCQKIERDYIPDSYISRQLDLRDYGLEDNFFLPTSVKSKISMECNQALVSALSEGDLMTIYFGHGSPNVWTHERILFGGDSKNSDMKRLTNGARLTFVVNLTCSTGGFDYPQKPWNICISEDMHRVKNGGAIALYCPSGLGFTPQHQVLTELLTKAIFADNQRLVGDAIGQSVIEYVFEKKNDLMPEMFILFGDPAMELALPKATFSMLATPNIVPAGKENSVLLSNSQKIPMKNGVGELVYANDTNLCYLPVKVQRGSFKSLLTIPALNTAATIMVKSYVADSAFKYDAVGAAQIAV